MKNDNFGKTGIFVMNVETQTRASEREREYATLNAQRHIQDHVMELLKSANAAKITMQAHTSEWQETLYYGENVRRQIAILAYFNNPEDAQIGDLCDIKITPTAHPYALPANSNTTRYFDPEQFHWKNETITLYRRTA